MRNQRGDASGQALTEYILIAAVMAVLAVLIFKIWQRPLADYFQHLAQALAKTR